MTDQIVSVPLDLLKRLFDNTNIIREVFAGDRVDVRPGAVGALIDIKALIPAPPKVGDELLASQTRELPFQTVLVDNEGDIWVSNGNGKFYMSIDGSEMTANLGTAFEPYTLVYLPDRD